MLAGFGVAVSVPVDVASTVRGMAVPVAHAAPLQSDGVTEVAVAGMVVGSVTTTEVDETKCTVPAPLPLVQVKFAVVVFRKPVPTKSSLYGGGCVFVVGFVCGIVNVS
jgi:hypothetical protein